MNRINYALISALYDTQGANLYNDVYFPIIKYTIVNQYYTQIDVEKYYDHQDLQSSIENDFGIKIPLVVLKQSIKAIEKGENGITLSVYDRGKQYKVRKAWDIEINTSIYNRSQELSQKFHLLESLYKSFLEVEQLPYIKSLVDFYSENTEDIFRYIENADGSSIVDEQYIHLAHFLTWLKDNNIDLFNIANDIFWGSVIAGFLKRNTADINIKPTNRVEYYIDSALVLAILDLDNIDNVHYAEEMLEIIKSSGNIPVVHSITVREINNILSSVEREQKPRANSAIEEAYYRRNLTPTKILLIKNQINRLIEEKGIIIFPVNERELDKIENEYRTKQCVKRLGKERGLNALINSGMREVHDIYMRDYIKKKRGNIDSIEKVNSYFVSLNNDLISFCNNDNSTRSTPVVIHPSKIIIDLWIHNSTSSFVKKNGLAEVMSRCFALNNTDVRRKIGIVSKYYKTTEENYSEDNYRAVCTALMNRSANALKEVDAITFNEQTNIENKQELNNNHIQALIKISVDEDIKRRRNSAELTQEKEKLRATITQKEQSLRVYRNESEQDKKRIAELEADLNKQKLINKITEDIDNVSSKLSELEKKKNKSISNIKFVLVISIESLFILFLAICVLVLLYSCVNSADNFIFKDYLHNNWKALVGACTTILGLILRIQKMYLLSPKIEYEKNRDKQVVYWKKKNPEYDKLKEELTVLKNSRDSLNSHIGR